MSLPKFSTHLPEIALCQISRLRLRVQERFPARYVNWSDVDNCPQPTPAAPEAWQDVDEAILQAWEARHPQRRRSGAPADPPPRHIWRPRSNAVTPAGDNPRARLQARAALLQNQDVMNANGERVGTPRPQSQDLEDLQAGYDDDPLAEFPPLPPPGDGWVQVERPATRRGLARPDMVFPEGARSLYIYQSYLDIYGT